MVEIFKAKKVVGANLYLRDILEDDAKFIFDLRNNPLKNKYLSETSGRLEDQINWIRSYKIKNDQAYFIICDKFKNRLGCIRMYNPIGDTYCWGSWLMINGLGPLVAIEAALLVYAYGKYLGFNEAKIDVRQENEYVWKFHEKFSSAKLVNQDHANRYYIVDKGKIDHLLIKFKNLITDPLSVEMLCT